MRKIIYAIAVGVLLATGGPELRAADTSHPVFDYTTRLTIRKKLVDNGDGTFSDSNPGSGASIASKTWNLNSKRFFVAPATMTSSGIGLSFLFKVDGGSCSFSVGGSSEIFVLDGERYMTDFKQLILNPTIVIHRLNEGATIQAQIETAQ